MPPILGCIADDFTGASDLALMLSRGGLRVDQTVGVPEGVSTACDADAVVVALKSRTVPAAEAVEAALAALAWLRCAGIRRFMFKYCSTFDSTPQGNIGPVADALADGLDASPVVVCPAFPENGRTLFNGHLFVGDRLLGESPMRDHPLTPMRDSDVVRLMAAQTPHKVGLIGERIVVQGSAAIRASLDACQAAGVRYAVVDAISDADLIALGRAVAADRLITGGSGIALGLPAAYAERGEIRLHSGLGHVPATGGAAAAISGSCSAATLEQVGVVARQWPTLEIGLPQAGEAERSVATAIQWAERHIGKRPFLIFSSAPPDRIAAVQALRGRSKAGAEIEELLAAIASALVARGVTRLIVAGGETSGAVVKKLGVRRLRVGAEIAPGVPWMNVVGDLPLCLALKSGNFGGPDFFAHAVRVSEGVSS